MSWRGGGEEGGRDMVESFPSTFLSSSGRRKKRDMRWRKTMGNRQMNESDIMNSHTLMRLIYCRHQQWWGGPVRRQGGGGVVWGDSQVSQRKAHTDILTHWHMNAHTQRHAWPGGVCVTAVCLTQPCVCCLDVYTSLSPRHTQTHTDTQRQCVFVKTCILSDGADLMALCDCSRLVYSRWTDCALLPFNEWDPPPFYILSALPSSPPRVFVSKLTVWRDGWMDVGRKEERNEPHCWF